MFSETHELHRQQWLQLRKSRYRSMAEKAIIKFGDYHYLLRSGFWVCKFIYVKGNDGLYHISEFYSNPDKNDNFARMFEIFRESYFNPSLFAFKDFTERYRKAIDELDNINCRL